jgi:hypothetical protein
METGKLFCASAVKSCIMIDFLWVDISEVKFRKKISYMDEATLVALLQKVHGMNS